MCKRIFFVALKGLPDSSFGSGVYGVKIFDGPGVYLSR